MHCVLMIITTLPYVLILFPISPIGTLKLRKFKWRASSLRAELFIMLLYLPHCMGFGGGGGLVVVLFCFAKEGR